MVRPIAINSCGPIIRDMSSSLAEMARVRKTASKMSQNTAQDQLSEAYLGVLYRIPAHIQALHSQLYNARCRIEVHKDQVLPRDFDSEDVQASLRAFPLLSEFWSTKCPPDMHKACKEMLEELMSLPQCDSEGESLISASQAPGSLHR